MAGKYREEGYPRAVALGGGVEAWEKAGYLMGAAVAP
jgi:hypothetical protein